MAFFDKLNDFAKNLGDKTTDAIETGKLTGKIHTEQNAAGEQLKKIGQYYYDLFAASGEAAPEVLEFCRAAKAHLDAAAQAQADIDRIRAENEAARQAAGLTCPGCGTVNEPGTRFCQNCGTRMEPAAPATVLCPGCGSQVPAGNKFCPQCGQKME